MPKSKIGDKCYRICVHQHTHLILKTIAIFVTLLLAFLVGKSTVINNYTQKQMPVIQESGTYQDGYEAGYSEAIGKLESAGVIHKSTDGVFKATIKSVNGRSIQIEIDTLGVDGASALVKTINVPESIQIYEYRPFIQQEVESNPEIKSQFDKLKKRNDAGEDVQMEVKDLLEKLSYKEIKISDLKSGDVLRIQSKTNIQSSDIL